VGCRINPGVVFTNVLKKRNDHVYVRDERVYVEDGCVCVG